MFGSEVLDVAIGLILVYLLLSLFATAVREAVESVFKTRAVFLEAGIRELLDDRDGAGLSRQLYEHPLVASLYRGTYDAGVGSANAGRTGAAGTSPNDSLRPRERMTGGNLPTHIPASAFSSALIDLVVRGPASAADSDLQRAAITLDSLRTGVELVGSPHVRRALHIALDDAGGDLAQAKANIEGWFDRSMERVSGWYKRRTHYWLLLIGALTTLALNVNTIAIAQHLAHSKAARELVVQRAAAVAGDSLSRVDAPAALRSLDLPLGWDHLPATNGAPVSWFLQEFVGLLLTALAITLGAPFWFDALNRVMQIRTTGSTVRQLASPAVRPPQDDRR